MLPPRIIGRSRAQIGEPGPASAPGRMEAVMAVMGSQVEIVRAKPATEKDIRAVHGDSHIEHIKRAGLYHIAALAAGGAVQTATLGLTEPAFGLIRPPGHHVRVVRQKP